MTINSQYLYLPQHLVLVKITFWINYFSTDIHVINCEVKWLIFFLNFLWHYTYMDDKVLVFISFDLWYTLILIIEHIYAYSLIYKEMLSSITIKVFNIN